MSFLLLDFLFFSILMAHTHTHTQRNFIFINLILLITYETIAYVVLLAYKRKKIPQNMTRCTDIVVVIYFTEASPPGVGDSKD